MRNVSKQVKKALNESGVHERPLTYSIYWFDDDGIDIESRETYNNYSAALEAGLETTGYLLIDWDKMQRYVLAEENREIEDFIGWSVDQIGDVLVWKQDIKPADFNLYNEAGNNYILVDETDNFIEEDKILNHFLK
jgi:hypothetical protein